jgi:hypothetical protein
MEIKISIKLVGMLLLAISGWSCRQDNPETQPLSVTVSSDMICRSGQPLKTSDPAPETSCIKYRYNDDKLLAITHLNAGFNCCPESFAADIEVKGDSLIIREGERKQGCKCNCLFNVEISVKNLPAESYHVRFVEPYAQLPEVQLKFDLDLKDEPVGEYCVTRRENWWY